MRGRSYSPSPPRGYARRGRSPSPRDRYGSRARDMPTSLLVRNLRHDCRPEDLRRHFERFGALKDVYLPKDYYTGEPRGFGFVQYVDPADAAEAKYQVDGQILLGRELAVVFAEENRKKPTEMRSRERVSHRGGRYRDRKRSPPRFSRSPPPRRGRSRSRSRDYHSPPPKKRYHSRSVSPEQRYSRDRSYSRSPRHNGSRSRSRSADRGQLPSRSADRVQPPSRSRSRSPRRSESPRHARSPSRSRSPRGNRDRSPSQ